jgi:ribonucleoside-diphosphate reductase alpha chain
MKTYTYDEAISASTEYFNGDDLAAKVFLDKYALRDCKDNLYEKTPDAMHKRMSKEFARIDSGKFKNPLSEDSIYNLFKNFKYIIPQGSPMFGIGNNFQTVSLSNCFVLDLPEDSYNSILDIDKQLVNISKRRGGVGIDLSKLRPEGTITNNASKTSTGIVSWMRRYSNSIREVGQCLHGDSLVLTSNGLKKIKLVKSEEMVWTKDGWTRVVKVFNNGKKKLFKVTTENGYSVTSSIDHIYQTFDDDGKLTETKLSDLEAGSSIVLCIGNSSQTSSYFKLKNNGYINLNNKPANCKLPSELTEKLSYILGYSYGDGYVDSRKTLELACSNDYPEIKYKLLSYIKTEFDYEGKIRQGDGALEKVSIHNKTIVNFLKFNGLLKQKAEAIEFPDAILASPPEVQKAFIAGYFDADGDVAGKKAGYRFRSINYKFLETTQRVLSTFGILSKISFEDRSDKGWQTLYTLGIVGQTSTQLMLDLIESVKISKSQYISKRECWLSPFKAKSFGIKHNNYSYCPDNTQYLSLATLNKLKSTEKVNTYLVQDRIKSIEEVNEDYTYDLQLESEHLFWCNGIYVHNSGRRGALMLTLSVHHPDVLKFATIKNNDTEVTGANISIRLSKEFLDALEKDEKYELRWPCEDTSTPAISKMVSAKEVWNTIINSAWLRAEPGLMMWDNILLGPADCYEKYRSVSSNPCSEITMCSLDSCRLLCQNLLSYVVHPFTDKAYFDFKLFVEHAIIAQRLMDDMVDLEAEKIEAILAKIDKDPETSEVKAAERSMWVRILEMNNSGRRTGTGVTAVGDALAALNLKYDSDEAIQMVDKFYMALKLGCYESSVEMAKELGHFDGWDNEKEKDCEFLKRFLNEKIPGVIDGKDVYNKMQKYGRRNVALLTTAPTGTVSLLTQTTSGIEPLFRLEPYIRRKKINSTDTKSRVDFVDKSGDKWQEFEVYHPTVKKWMNITGVKDLAKSPWYNCTANDINWVNRVKLQATAQKHVCHAISSTVNLPNNATEEEVSKIYIEAFKSGCKGITIYRDGCRSGVLVEKNKEEGRPKELPCDVHHTTVGGTQYLVLVGLKDGTPYEVFACRNGILDKSVKSGTITKKRENFYKAEFENDLELSPITASMAEMEEIISRLTSALLRSGADMHLVVKQLEKVGETKEIHSFARGVARVLKKYIPDGTEEKEKCPECSGKVIREEGCKKCIDCGWSKCN